ncbi:MAG: hypothetical protein ACK4YQ_05140 [Phenylobacterium sp.]|uniref:hypothetical protein n=1 Tax=Phenylobacterium sp. TaxID=1871053 RepID=UPI003919EFA7
MDSAPETASTVWPARVGSSRRSVLGGALAAALSAPLTGAARGDLVWGVNGHPFTAYPGIPLEQQLDLTRDLGMTSYRVNGAGVAELDHILPLAEARGIAILPILEVDGWTDSPLPQVRERAFELGRTMARHFRGRVPVWELGNEMENFAIIQPCEIRDDGTKYPCEWGPAGGVGPLEYVGARWAQVSAALDGLSKGVAEGDPKALRAMGTAGWGHLGAVERMAQDGLAWDITVWHDYEGVRESYLAKLASYGRPIWITEFNAGGGNFASRAENARQLAARIAYYRRMRTAYRIEAAHVYELLDEPYWSDFEAHMGLYTVVRDKTRGWRVGPPKPAAKAVKRALGTT